MSLAALSTSPDAALWTLFAGLLLVYFECNRPGSIVPGCLGALLILLALNGFAHMPLRPAGLALSAIGMLLILFEAVRPTWNLSAAAGTASLIGGFATLVQPFATARVHTSTAIATGCGLAFSTLWLVRIAVTARRNKRSMRRLAPASQRRTG